MSRQLASPELVIPRPPLYSPVTHRAFEAFARGLFRFYCPLRVTGREQLPSTPFVLCSNHASHMDSVALMRATGLPFDRFGLLAADDYFFRNPLVYRWFAGMVQLIPISRTAGPGSLKRTIALCRAFMSGGDRRLIAFPEGTRSRSGELLPFKRGISLLAAELGVPIVPAYIAGSGARMPKGRMLPAPGGVGVHIGAPMPAGRDGGHQAFARTLESAIRALRDDSDGA